MVKKENIKGKKMYHKWWFWLVLAVLGGVLIYLVINPAWITHTKYMLDDKYCESDEDCVIDGDSCDVINKYNYKESQFACQWTICNTHCNKNKCVFKTDCRGN